jgi:hypothetical protein
MTDKPPEAPPGRRKRAAPTIDLTATDVSPAAAPPEPAPEPPPQAAAPPPEPEPETVAAETPREPPPRPSRRALVLAGFAGALLVILVAAGAVWVAGSLFPPSPDDAPLRAQIAALQKQVQDLQNRPAPSVDTKTVDALSGRLAKIESDIARLPPSDASIGERLSAADNAVKSLGVALTALSQRGNDAAVNAKQALDRADAAERATRDLQESVQRASTQASAAGGPAGVASLTQRIAALEQSMTDARAQISANATTDQAARLALSAAALRDAVERGKPFPAELAQAQLLATDRGALAELIPYATTGVPTADALAQELHTMLPALAKASGVQPSGNFIERLQANAGKLVRVRPVNAPTSDDDSAILGRLEVATAKTDIPAAIADLQRLLNASKLTDASRTPEQRWINDARARQKALAAARAFAADTARALKP